MHVIGSPENKGDRKIIWRNNGQKISQFDKIKPTVSRSSTNLKYKKREDNYTKAKQVLKTSNKEYHTFCNRQKAH